MERRYKNKTQGRQLVLFNGITLGDKIAPTDIDGVIEYLDKYRILYEVKHANWDGRLSVGQRLTLERFVDDFTRVGKPSIAIVAVHDTCAPEDILLGECDVARYYAWYTHGRWVIPKKRISVREATERFLSWMERMGDQWTGKM